MNVAAGPTDDGAQTADALVLAALVPDEVLRTCRAILASDEDHVSLSKSHAKALAFLAKWKVESLAALWQEDHLYFGRLWLEREERETVGGGAMEDDPHDAAMPVRDVLESARMRSFPARFTWSEGWPLTCTVDADHVEAVNRAYEEDGEVEFVASHTGIAVEMPDHMMPKRTILVGASRESFRWYATFLIKQIMMYRPEPTGPYRVCRVRLYAVDDRKPRTRWGRDGR